jgi:Na+/H+-dicarboxylate symporter
VVITSVGRGRRWLERSGSCDAFDTRWLRFGVQIYFIVVAALLAGLTAAGLMPPALLLTFTFAAGAGQAMLSPTWRVPITELVPRNEFAAAQGSTWSSQQLPLDADGYGLLFAALRLGAVIASARRRAKGEKQGAYGGDDQHREMITNGMVD